jgi:hypothetical protein
MHGDRFDPANLLVEFTDLSVLMGTLCNRLDLARLSSAMKRYNYAALIAFQQ